jgi:hypothetical protein
MGMMAEIQDQEQSVMRHGLLSEDPLSTIQENRSKVRCLLGVSFGAVLGWLLAWGVSRYAAGFDNFMMMAGFGFVTGSTATLVVGWEGGIGQRHALLAGSVALGVLTVGLFVTGLLTTNSVHLNAISLLPGTLIGALSGRAILHPILGRRSSRRKPESNACPFTPDPVDVVVTRRNADQQMREVADIGDQSQSAPIT